MSVSIRVIYQFVPFVFCLLAILLVNPGCSSISGPWKGKAVPVGDGIGHKSLPWGMYLLNNERLATTEDGLPQPLSFYWSFRISSKWKILPYHPTQHSAPAVVDNIVYIGSSDKRFYAIDIKGKRILWEFSTTGAVESSPVVHHNRVYFGTNDGILYCLDVRDGHEIWRVQARTEIISSPLVAGDVVYFTAIDDRLYALNASTGEKLWQYGRESLRKVTKRPFASLSFYNGRLYGVLSDGHLIALVASTGREVWKKRIGDEAGGTIVRLTPTIDGGLIYVINRDKTLVALDGEKGGERWRFDITQVVDFVIKKNTLFLINPEGAVFAVNKITGEVLWRRKTTKGNPVASIAAGNYLIIASRYSTAPFDVELLTMTTGYIDIFTDKGERVWSEKVDSGISTTPVVAYNQLLFVTDKGYLYIYGARP